MAGRRTRLVTIGDVCIGAENPVRIQSMTNTRTEDIKATAAQIQSLAAAGCEIVRCAVPTMEAASALTEIRKQIDIPLVADIHFDYRLAIAAIEHGADKIRINPGNIGDSDRVRAVVCAARERNIPIRVGANGGSLPRELLQKYGGATPEAIVESALAQVGRIEDMGYDQLVISVKSSDVRACARAYELIAEKTDHPLHVGITEAGTVFSGCIKSSAFLALVLSQGIGDTIRVSLTGDPAEEVRAAKEILRALGLRTGVEIISCPTCGRTEIDLAALANEAERLAPELEQRLDARGVLPKDRPFRIAIMGCVVNGPGEAREADLGLAGGRGEGLIFRGGEVISKVPEGNLLQALLEEVEKF